MRGFGSRFRRRCSSRTRRRTRTGRSFRCPASIRTIGVNERKTFKDDLELALLLLRVFIFPSVLLETALNEQWTAFFHVLADDFSLAPPNIHVHKAHFFLALTALAFPSAVHRQSYFCDRRSFGRVTQFRIARQIAHQDDFVEVGHDNFYAAGFGSGASVNSTRNTSSLSANFFCNCAIMAGAAVKMTLA